MGADSEIFRQLLTDTNLLHGWTIPHRIVNYQAEIFSGRLRDPSWQPQPSYAEHYMRIQTVEQARAFADVCWFTRAVFPELGERRGLNERYYTDLGQGCYDYVIRTSSVPSPVLETMRNHFEFLAETAYIAIRHYGDFRSMWD